MTPEPVVYNPSPCPVCGASELGSATGLVFVFRPYYDENESFRWGIKISCQSCGFEGPEVSGENATTKAAVDAWDEAVSKKTIEQELSDKAVQDEEVE